jgi:hypothetical protein
VALLGPYQTEGTFRVEGGSFEEAGRKADALFRQADWDTEILTESNTSFEVHLVTSPADPTKLLQIGFQHYVLFTIRRGSYMDMVDVDEHCDCEDCQAERESDD